MLRLIHLTASLLPNKRQNIAVFVLRNEISKRDAKFINGFDFNINLMINERSEDRRIYYLLYHDDALSQTQI